MKKMITSKLKFFFPPIDYFIHSKLRQEENFILIKSRLIVLFSLSIFVWGIIFAIFQYWSAAHLMPLIQTATSLAILIPIFVLRQTGSVVLSANLLIALAFLSLDILSTVTNGLHSTALLWTAGLPLTVTLLADKKSGFYWAIFSIFNFAMFYIFDVMGIRFEQYFSPSGISLDLFLSLGSFSLIIYFFAWLYASEYSEMVEHLEEANRKLEKAHRQLEEKNEELEKRNIALKKAEEEARRRSEEKSRFVTIVSHDLRSPLNSMLGYLEMWIEDCTDAIDTQTSIEIPELLKDLKKIHTGGKFMKELIENLLDLAHIESQNVDMNFSQFSIKEFVEEVFNLVEPLIKKKNNQFHYEIEDEQLQITADRQKLKRSLVNLLSNAAKFTENGEITLEISKKMQEGKQWIHLAVKDTGIGLTEDEIKNLFKPFSQANGSISEKYGGTGLGLEISRGLCTLMGGDIMVTSQKSKGSTFTIFLPLDVSPPTSS